VFCPRENGHRGPDWMRHHRENSARGPDE
jgi:hypothetical protein